MFGKDTHVASQRPDAITGSNAGRVGNLLT